MPYIIQNNIRKGAGWEIAVLTISRPEQLNALSLEIIAELGSVIDEIMADKNIRCVIITGDGKKAFVAGADTKELETLDTNSARQLSLDGNRVFQKIQDLPIPVIAAVNGFAFGGGCELALACDIRIASDNAIFSLPEVSLGLYPGWGGTRRLFSLIGYAKAAEIVFTAVRIDAKKSLEIGLVNQVVSQDQLMESAIEMAEKIAVNAPLAIRAAKRVLHSELSKAENGFELEVEEFSALFSTEDTKNGLKAFNNKQKYTYMGL